LSYRLGSLSGLKGETWGTRPPDDDVGWLLSPVPKGEAPGAPTLV